MNVFTITERRDDPRLLNFAELCAKIGATKILILTRPDHVSPDPSQLVSGQAQVDHFVGEERKAANEGRYDDAKAHRDEAKVHRGLLQKVHDDSAKWITDIYDRTGPAAKGSTGFAIMSYDQWPEAVEWSVKSVMANVRQIDDNGIGGTQFSVPLSRRVFIPLSAFDSVAVSSVSVEAKNTDPNKPKTAATKIDVDNYNDTQKNILMVLNEIQKKLVTTALGWDRHGVGRSIKETAAVCGLTQKAARTILDKAADILTTIDVNLKALELESLTRKAPEAPKTGTDEENDPLA